MKFPCPSLVISAALGGSIPVATSAQPTFMRMYNEGHEGRAVREVGGNAYVVAGGTDLYWNWHFHLQSPIPSTGVHHFKTDDQGNLLWERIHSKFDARTIATWMEPTADGGYIIAGNSNSDKVWPPDSNDVLLIKTNALGNIIWSETFDTGKDEVANCVRQTSDGGYIVSGFHDGAPISFSGTTRVLLIKTDGAGNLQWSHKYEFGIRDIITGAPFTYVVRELADDGFAIVGTTVGGAVIGVYVIRTDGVGNVLWANVYPHDLSIIRHSTGLDILETPTGELIVAGSMDKSQPNEKNYPYLMRLSAAGSLLEARFYETAPLLSFQSGFSSVIGTDDGGFFFTGMGGYGEFGDQMQLLKTDPALDMEWSRVYTADGIATMGSRSARPSTDGGYVFTGKRQFAGTVLMKTDAQGLIPCKNPNVLVELPPIVLESVLTPGTLPGILASPVLLNTISPLIDVAEICPVTIPLPVELVTFTATPLPQRKAGLRWSTATETGNDLFIIERSADAAGFEEVAHIDGAGNSQHTIDYAFTDEHPLLTDISYYRLRQVDVNSVEKFSPTVAVQFDSDGFVVISANSDPANGTLNIVIGSTGLRTLGYRVWDVMGRTVASGTSIVEGAIARLAIDAHGWTRGTYGFVIIAGKEALTGRSVY
ncbi:MAG: hypothetical protein ABI599_07380 [Flavobacteriales bacterium]